MAPATPGGRVPFRVHRCQRYSCSRGAPASNCSIFAEQRLVFDDYATVDFALPHFGKYVVEILQRTPLIGWFNFPGSIEFQSLDHVLSSPDNGTAYRETIEYDVEY